MKKRYLKNHKIKRIMALALAVSMAAVPVCTDKVYAEEINEDEKTYVEPVYTDEQGICYYRGMFPDGEYIHAVGISSCDPDKVGGDIVIPSNIPEHGTPVVAPLAFKNCKKVKSVKIPAEIKQISGGAFAGCDNLTSIEIDENNPNYCVVDGAILSKDKTTLIQCPPAADTYTVPDFVTVIEEYAFAYCKVKEVILHEGITAIQDCAFTECNGIKEIRLPNAINIIERDMFSDCKNLEKVEFGDSIEFFDKNAFMNCAKLKELYIPSGVNSLDAFGEDFISGCTNLKKITLSDANTGVCVDSQMCIYTSDMETLICASPSASKIIVPDGVKTIHVKAFAYNSKLKEVSIPGSVTTVRNAAFHDCSSLETVSISEGVVSVEDRAFAKCTSLEYIRFPESLTDTGIYIFADCTKLKGVYIPASVTEIEEKIFDYMPEDCVVYGVAGSEIETFINQSAPNVKFSTDMSTFPEIKAVTPDITQADKEDVSNDNTSQNNTSGDSEGAQNNTTDTSDNTVQNNTSGDSEAAQNNTTDIAENIDINNTPSNDTETLKVPEAGAKIVAKDSKCEFKVLSSDGTQCKVSYTASLATNDTNIVVPSVVTMDGVTYKVTSIAKNAFKKCKKLKKITIKSTYITKFEKNAFNGVNKKVKISVPKSKKAAYKKLIKKSGCKCKIV